MGSLDMVNKLGMAFVQYGWAMLWQSSVLIVLLLAADGLMKKRVRAVVRYAVWMLVLVKLVLPVGLALPTSPWYWVDRGGLTSSKVQPDRPKAGLQAAEGLVLEAEQPGVREKTPDDSSPAMLKEPSSKSEGAAQAATLGGRVVAPAASVITDEAVGEGPSWPTMLLLIWCGTVVLLLGMLIQRYWFVRDLVRQAQPASDYYLTILNRCRNRLSIRAQLEVRISPNASSPSVCGLVKPVILIPVSMVNQLQEEQIESVLLHELAHVKRGDLWINLLQTLLQIVYFFHPLLWLANAAIRQVREQAVDEAVLVAMGDRAEEYPQTLLSVSKLAWSRPLLSLRLIGVVESKSALAGRIRHILSRPLPRKARIGLVAFSMLVLVAMVILPMAQGGKEPQFVLKGVVSDKATGKPIVGAKVGDDGYTDGKYGAITDENGRYEYKTWYEEHNIICQVNGYQSMQKTLFTLAVGSKQSEDMNFELETEGGVKTVSQAPDFTNLDFWKGQINDYLNAVRTIDGEFLTDRQVFKEGNAEPEHYRSRIRFKWNRDQGWYDYDTRDLRDNGHYERNVLNDRYDWWVTDRSATKTLAGKSDLIRQYQFGVMSEPGEWWPGNMMGVAPVAELIASDFLRIMVHQMKWDLRPVACRAGQDGTYELILKEVQMEDRTLRIGLTVAWEDGFKLLALTGQINDEPLMAMSQWSDHVKAGGVWFARKAVHNDYKGDTVELDEIETTVAERVAFNRPLAAEDFEYRPEVGMRINDKVEKRDYVAWPDLEKIKASGGKERIAITGKVLLDGKPVAGVRVETMTLYDPNEEIWRTISSVTDEQGAFILDGLLPGFTYNLTAVQASSGTTMRANQEVATRPDGTDIKGVTIGMASGLTLRGVVTRYDGSQAAGAVVAVSGSNEIDTDQAGAFRVMGLRPDVVYTIQIAARGCAPVKLENYKVVVDEAGQLVTPLTIQLEQERVLTGRMVDKNGNGLANKRIIGFFSCFVGQEHWQWCNTYTDSDGNFRLGNLGTEPYEIWFEEGGHRWYRASDSPVLIRSVNGKFALEDKPGRRRVPGDILKPVEQWERKFIDWFQQEDQFYHGNMRVERITRWMEEAKGADQEKRNEALVRLGNIEAAQAVGLLVEIQEKSTDVDELGLAMRALGRIGQMDSASSLIKRLGDKDALVAAVARVALAEIYGKDWGDSTAQAWEKASRDYWENRRRLAKTNGPDRLMKSCFEAVAGGDYEAALAAFLPGSGGAERIRMQLGLQEGGENRLEQIKQYAHAIDWPEMNGGDVTTFPDRINNGARHYRLKTHCEIGGQVYQAGENYRLFGTVFREVGGQWWLLELTFPDEVFGNSM